MTLILQRMYDVYREFMEERRDMRSAHLPLAGSPWPLMLLLATYLYGVLHAGPRFMAQRKAYDLRSVIRVYNIVQVLINSVIFLWIVIKMFIVYRDYNFSCQVCNYSTDYRGMEEMYLSYSYFLLKVLDLADTVFFVLRKKQSHVSFLHVYHHTVMVIGSYFGMLYVPGGHAIMLGIWNTLVHAVMYLYYFLSSYGSQYSGWWKQHLTRMQLLQFIHLAFHFGIPLFFNRECKFPRFWMGVGFLQALVILGLFMDFYIKSYIVKRKEHASLAVRFTFYTMALIIRSIYSGYNYLVDKTDERVLDLPLLRSVWTVPLISGAYLYFVLNVGPKLMANRKPIEMRRFLCVYNLFQVVANVWTFAMGLKYLHRYPYSHVCQPVQNDAGAQSTHELRIAYAYFLLKILDLADTVFFVLRKKQSHVSFLHVYHHTIMAVSASLFMRYLAGGHAIMLGMLNTFVHAVMYFYFFLTIYRPELTRGASWKRYVTLLQMTQFAYLVFHFFRPIVLGVDCGYPRAVMWFVGLQNIFMLVMFADFYRRSYLKSPKARAS
uniref:Elongation of very long chain fatty acids protein n=1 Tax=Anopheles epiroticus TaxID=199890 RepID=A0A182PT22_9DIPT